MRYPTVMPRLAGRAQVTSATEHAAENLRFIRHAMERSSTFTAVPGAGGAAMGAIGLVAAVVGSRAADGRAMADGLADGGGRGVRGRRLDHAPQGGATGSADDRRARAAVCAEPVGAARGRCRD